MITLSNHPKYDYSRQVDVDKCSFTYDTNSRQLKIAVVVETTHDDTVYDELQDTFILTARDVIDDNQPLVNQATGDKVWKYVLPENYTREWSGSTYRVYDDQGDIVDNSSLEQNPDWDEEALMTEFAYFSFLKSQQVSVNDIINITILDADALKRFG